MARFIINATRNFPIQGVARIEDALTAFKKAYPDADINSINNQELIGYCIVSGEPILADDQYTNWNGEYVLLKNYPNVSNQSE